MTRAGSAVAERPAREALPDCTHCGLTVPRGLVESGAEEQFCCGACRTAYGAIRACGLGAYYELREKLEQGARPARSTGGAYEEFDAETFWRVHVRESAETGLASCELYLDGVHCAACVWLVERVPQIVQGVVEARLDLGRSLVRLTWEPGRVKLSAVARAIDALGYRAHAPGRNSQRAARRVSDRRALVRIGIAGALAGNAMLLAVALYAGMFEGMDAGTRMAFRLTSAGLAVLSVAWPGRVFFQGAIAAARTRAWHLDMPIALALGVGLAAGLVNAVRDTGEVFFDTITMLVFLLLIGRWLQRRGQRAAAEALEMLFAITPSSAHVVADDGTLRDEPIESVVPGVRVEVLAGESVPVDGVIVSGRSHMDQSVMTGESRPVPMGQGDRVAAGTVSLSSPVRVLAEAVGDQTRLGRVMRDIERHAREQTPIIGHANRIAGVFVAAVLALAGVTMALWIGAGLDVALGHATALLIVCCPCALAMATPLVTAVAVGRAAKAGVLIKGAGAFEHITRPGVVLMDKTGTLTRGEFRCVRWIGDASIAPAVAALERGSPHPIARALSELDDECLYEADEVEHRLGLGVVGRVGDEHLAAGSGALMESIGVEVGEEFVRAAARGAGEGHTPIYLSRGDAVCAVALLGDELRAESEVVVDRLRAMGWRVGIVSGDRADVVREVAGRLGIEPALARGGMSPEEKVAAVREAAALGPVVMVGDGVNDAAALAQASFGVALQGGAEASLAAAHAYIVGDDLSMVPELIEGAGRTVRVVKVCLAASLGYNVVAAGLAMAGVLSPLVAAVLMPASSVTVLAIALRARTFAGPQ